MKNILLTLLLFSFTSILFCQENLDWRKSYKGKIEIEKTANDFIEKSIFSRQEKENYESEISLKKKLDVIYNQI